MLPHLRLNVHAPKSRMDKCPGGQDVPEGRRPNAAAIISAVLQGIEDSSLPKGGRLPPVRVLAHQLGISKNTAHAAYDELIARGLVNSESRRGYFVAGDEVLETLQPRFTPTIPALHQPTLRERHRPHKEIISLSSVFVAPELLPKKRLVDCFRSALSHPGLLTFYDAQGYPPLRQAIADRLARRGIPAKAEHVIITTGSQQALDIVCRALVSKRIATENPAYSIGKRLFELNALEVTDLLLDPFRGINLAAWEAKIEESKPPLLYLTSNFQNPTGYSYTTNELQEILRMSETHGFGILEDDWGSDMLSFSEFHPPLRALGGENVLYMNSFTKKLLPSLRLGYILANDQTTEALVEGKRVATLGNPTLVEVALAEFLDRGYFDQHLQALQEELDRRHLACLEILRRVMPEEVRWTTPGGGPIIWLEVPNTIDLPQLKDRLYERRVQIELSESAFFGPPHLSGFRIGFAYLTTDLLERGLTITAEVIEELG